MKHWSVIFLLLSLSCRPAEESAPTPAPAFEPVGFANPDLLVETDWLAEHAADTSVRIVDARAAEAYEAGHIPGAIHIAREDTYDPDAEIRATVGPPEQIAALFGPKGIDEYAHVVVYDKGVATRAARIFWTLEYYGHPNVSVLNGGFDKWQAEARDVTTEALEVAPVTFTVQRNASALTTRDRILVDLDATDAVILDVRTPEEFSGEDARAERGGHIPGAVHLEWTQNYTADEVPIFKSALELSNMYEQAGVTKDKRVHAY